MDIKKLIVINLCRLRKLENSTTGRYLLQTKAKSKKLWWDCTQTV